jgi:dTDP-glucose pyrophosphorylase/predicted transcriptional regulator
MKNTLNKTLSPNDCLRDAIKAIEINIAKIVFIIDDKECLVGSVSDGDIRRALLIGGDLDSPISKIMNPNPVVAHSDNYSNKHVLKLMKDNDLRYIPILNGQNKIQSIQTAEDFQKKDLKDNWVFLMAGGLGERLYPLTQTKPKPLLTVGNKPILENILESFIDHGFRNFFVSVNYKANMIEDYFGDGRKWGVEIQYIRESKPLGTGGSLGLLPNVPEKPIIMMNGDILTKVNFEKLLDFHHKNNSIATMCIRKYDYQIPYGTVVVDNQKVTSIIEKPIHNFFVNAGIYVLEPEILNGMKKNLYQDMPNLLEKLMQNKKQVSAFPLHEYWLDIGQMDDLERAQSDYIIEFYDN